MSIERLPEVLDGMKLLTQQQKPLVSRSEGNQGESRLPDGCRAGLLTLSSATGTLSGGEAQRIRLATQIGPAWWALLYPG